MHFHHYNVTFIHCPKTAGTSVIRALGGNGTTHEKLSEVGPGTTIGTVRNPLDRLVSIWAYFRQGGNQVQDDDVQAATPEYFSDFLRCYVRDQQPYPRQYFLDTMASYLTDGDREVTHLLRFEQLAQDWSKLAIRLGLPGLLGKHRVSRHKYYRDHYTPELVKIVGDRYAEDFERYGYEL